MRLRDSNPHTFLTLPLYRPEEFLPFHDDHKKSTASQVEKRGIRFFEGLLDQATQVKMHELMAEYFLSVILRDKAGMIIRRIFMVRAQIIILIAMLKLVKMGIKFV